MTFWKNFQERLRVKLRLRRMSDKRRKKGN
jgi:hypothetical protein